MSKANGPPREPRSERKAVEGKREAAGRRGRGAGETARVPPAASARRATASCAGPAEPAGAAQRRERRGAEAGVTVGLRGEPFLEPACGGAEAAVGGQPLRQLLGRLLGVEALQVELLAWEQAASLQLEQRGHEHEKLPAGLEVELASLEPGFHEREHDLGHVDVAQLRSP